MTAATTTARRQQQESHNKNSNSFLLGAAPPQRNSENDDGGEEEDKLAKLGYSKEEIRRSRGGGDSEQPPNVNVNLLPDVDAVTLTAVGFALIAFNFFVLANSGDGGLAGAVATIINMSKQ